MNELEARLRAIPDEDLNQFECYARCSSLARLVLQRGDYEEMEQLFRQAISLAEGDDTLLEQELALGLHYAGRRDEAWSMLEHIEPEQLEASTMLRFSRVAYLASEYERGAWVMSIMLRRYIEMPQIQVGEGAADGNGPFFIIWLNIAPHYLLSGRLATLESITAELEPVLNPLELMLARGFTAWRAAGDPQELSSGLHRFRDNYPQWISGLHNELMLSVFDAHLATDLNTALAILAASRCDLLALPGRGRELIPVRAALAWRHGADDMERELRHEFLSDAPMLLHLEWTLKYGVLDYQEFLKPTITPDPTQIG